ncbi:MAG TPA: glycogen/starch/alpha-glucan phosphorylase [Candidatus Binatia bacterium]|nr:glycogen/starch/alpha-glucan phosphorylase [Candidatus Binatia bacterium]
MEPLTTEPHAPSRKDVHAFEDRIYQYLRYSLGRKREGASRENIYLALAYAVKHDLLDRMIDTVERYERNDPKRIYYLSIEYLLGRFLRDSMRNLGIYEIARLAVREFGFELDNILNVEPDAGLGTGGLGRLAACFLDSMATLGIPCYGYGIHYEYGMFRQEIANGYQMERPDSWLREGMPWQVERIHRLCFVPLYGEVIDGVDRHGRHNPMWLDWKLIASVPYDFPISGYGGRTVNILRLFAARGSEEFDMSIFNAGDYIRAVEQKIRAETITKVLYPSDAVQVGRDLRLIQEYFLIFSAIRDILNRHQRQHTTFENLPDKVAIQLNDTHPALAIAELMRVLVDHHEVPWERAWDICYRVFGYTNHTLLPEALEKWPVPTLQVVLPRHLQVIYEINEKFLGEVKQRFPGESERMRRMSLVEEGEPKQVRMAHLAIVGSKSTNGVSKLHSALLRTQLVPDFAAFYPERFNNKTNGVSHRRWLLYSNPGLAALISRAVGADWLEDLDKLRGLEACAGDDGFQQEFLRVKQGNKDRLAALIKDTLQITSHPESIFDVQVKRIHEYKRQLLNLLHIMHLYLRAAEDRQPPAAPRTFVFSGKAAPGYFKAKLIVKLIHNVAAVVNRDRRVRDVLRVAFLPDFSVTLAERIIPAADLSEQISTAGMEASGTGNMKLAMNGALTIGTLDGANIEILEEVGAENLYIFGLNAEQVTGHRRAGSYHPREFYERDDAIRRVLDALGGNLFCPFEPGLFQPLYNSILNEGDPYFHLADFTAYVEAQERAAADFKDRTAWARKAILTVARMGKFSSDRTISEYARDIWGVEPVVD